MARTCAAHLFESQGPGGGSTYPRGGLWAARLMGLHRLAFVHLESTIFALNRTVRGFRRKARSLPTRNDFLGGSWGYCGFPGVFQCTVRLCQALG